MIQLTFDIVAGTAKLSSSATTIVLGADVPVQIVFSAAPGTMGAIAIALGSDAAPPALLAYSDSFESENSTTYNALLDCSDTRLVAFMTGKGPASVNAQVSAIIDGVNQIAPNVALIVQPNIVSGDPTSDGGPTYYTQAQTDSQIAAAVVGLSPAPEQADLTPAAAVTAALFAATFFSDLFIKIRPVAGSGAFVAAYTLPDGSQTRAASVKVAVELPASANPTVTLYDGGAGLLETVTNPAPAAVAYWIGNFRFDGAAWHCTDRYFQL